MAKKSLPAPSEDQKYYWLRLHKDFFKRHDTRIIEKMENGKDYVLFYLKLLAESIDHMGELRFSETIPYDIGMLATITDTNVDIVRTAIRILSELHLVEVIDEGTFYMTQVESMMGSETVWAERKRNYRRNKQLEDRTLSGQKSDMSDKSKRESKSKREINNPLINTPFEDEKFEDETFEDPKPVPERFHRPTIEQVTAYCKSRGNSVDPRKWFDHYTANGWKVGKVTMKDWQATVRTWEPTGFKPKSLSATTQRICPKCGTKENLQLTAVGQPWCHECFEPYEEQNGTS